MIELSDKTLCKPLDMIYMSCLANGVFPSIWKMVNLVRPVSLLPICDEISDLLKCVKSVRIPSYSSPFFPAFGLNAERYEKMRTRITPNMVTFHTVNLRCILIL